MIVLGMCQQKLILILRYPWLKVLSPVVVVNSFLSLLTRQTADTSLFSSFCNFKHYLSNFLVFFCICPLFIKNRISFVIKQNSAPARLARGQGANEKVCHTRALVKWLLHLVPGHHQASSCTAKISNTNTVTYIKIVQDHSSTRNA